MCGSYDQDAPTKCILENQTTQRMEISTRNDVHIENDVKDKKRDAIAMLLNDINVNCIVETTGLPLRKVNYLKKNVVRKVKMAMILIKNGFPLEKVGNVTNISKNILENYFEKDGSI